MRRLLTAMEPIINEFMAKNQTGLTDKYGDHSDWIEIANPNPATSVNLGGYHLKYDDGTPADWVFPNPTNVAGNGFVVVFASGKNTVYLGEMHTNFVLNAGGATLQLVKPDNTTVVSQYAPYPEQLADISYGLGPWSSAATTMTTTGDDAEMLIPTSSNPGTTAWTSSTFDNSSWPPAATGIGFDRPTNQTLPGEVEPNDTWSTANVADYNFATYTGNLYQMSILGNFGTSEDWFKIGNLQAGDRITISDATTVSSPARWTTWRWSCTGPTGTSTTRR